MTPVYINYSRLRQGEGFFLILSSQHLCKPASTNAFTYFPVHSTKIVHIRLKDPKFIFQ